MARHCEGVHPDPEEGARLGCPRCRIYVSDPRIARQIDESPNGVNRTTVLPPRGSNTKGGNRSRTSQPLICKHRGEDPLPAGTAEAMKLPTGKLWYRCAEHMGKRVPLYVCHCEGCGPSCKGYVPDPDHPSNPVTMESRQETTSPDAPVKSARAISTPNGPRRTKILPAQLNRKVVPHEGVERFNRGMSTTVPDHGVPSGAQGTTVPRTSETSGGQSSGGAGPLVGGVPSSGGLLPVPRAAPQPDRSSAPRGGRLGGPWAYGVTTLGIPTDGMPERRHNLLPRTLESLSRAGFTHPRLFVDACDSGLYNWYEKYFPDLRITPRYPRVGAYANWCLSLMELFFRNPDAERYALFQDDILACTNVRQYLEAIPFPDKGYLNLTTFMENEALATPRSPKGFHIATSIRHNRYVEGVKQRGRGGMGLVFSRQALLALASSRHVKDRLLPDRRDPNRYFRFIDGAVAEAMHEQGYLEYVHNPSLIQHNGPKSTITAKTWGPRALAKSFPGESYDCLSLLPQKHHGDI